MINWNWRKAKAHLGVFLRGKVYDWAHRVDTTGIVQISELSVLGKNGSSAIQYEPLSPDELAETLRQIDVRFEDYTFVDFGSGKGRGLPGVRQIKSDPDFRMYKYSAATGFAARGLD